MNIIFDSNLANELSQKYTVLELDTVMQEGLPAPLTLYAVIEITNVGDISTLEFHKNLHGETITAYKGGDWSRAIDLASGLKGQFGGELDEFYDLVIDFSEESLKNNITWDGIKFTVPSEQE